MGNALNKLSGGLAARLDHLVAGSTRLLAAPPARCAVCGATLGMEADEDHAATEAFAARHRAAYAGPALPASHYTLGMRVFLWDSGCLAVVTRVVGERVTVDDLHVDPEMGRQYRGMVYPARQLRPTDEVA